MGHCGAVVKELLDCAKKPGSTPGDTVFCFSVPFFSLFSLIFLNAIFPFDLFFFILNADPARHAPGSIYIFSLTSEEHWPSLRPEKKNQLSRHVPPLKQLNFFQC